VGRYSRARLMLRSTPGANDYPIMRDSLQASWDELVV
jgi:hypothetical protein